MFGEGGVSDIAAATDEGGAAGEEGGGGRGRVDARRRAHGQSAGIEVAVAIERNRDLSQSGRVGGGDRANCGSDADGDWGGRAAGQGGRR
jgi:hypothetical protein